MRRYKVEFRFAYWSYVVILPSFLLLSGAFLFYMAGTESKEAPPAWFALVWIAAVLNGGHGDITMPNRIEVTGDCLINFAGAFRRTTVAPQDIISVKVIDGGFVKIRHNGRRIRLLRRFTDFHEFLSELKRVKQNANFRGC